METVTLNGLSPSGFNNVESLFTECAKDRVRARIQNSYTTSYMLTEDEVALLSKYLQRNIVFDTQQLLKRSSHPVASCLNEFARHQAFYINHGHYLNIGGNPAKENGTHFCHLINDCRNHDRLLQNAMNPQICTQGAENCTALAPNGIAIAIDSLYDIPIENLHTIFNQHQITILHAWMFLPLELIDDDLLKDFNNPLYKMQCYEHADKRRMAMFNFKNDLSCGYAHDFANWKKYLTTSIIEGEEYHIFSEIKRNYGPFCYLTFTRVQHTNPPPRVLPFADFYNNYIKIPNFTYIVNHNFNVKYADVPKLVIPKRIAQSLYSYIARGPDSSFSYERAATYFHGITSKIVIANQVLVEDLGAFGHEYDEVCFSIIALATIARLRRTKTFGTLIRNLDNNFDGRTLIALRSQHTWSETITDLFKRFTSLFRLNKHGKEPLGDYFNIADSKNFMMFDMEPFKDFVIQYMYSPKSGRSWCMRTLRWICNHARSLTCACKRSLCICTNCHNYHGTNDISYSESLVSSIFPSRVNKRPAPPPPTNQTNISSTTTQSNTITATVNRNLITPPTPAQATIVQSIAPIPIYAKLSNMTNSTTTLQTVTMPSNAVTRTSTLQHAVIKTILAATAVTASDGIVNSNISKSSTSSVLTTTTHQDDGDRALPSAQARYVSKTFEFNDHYYHKLNPKIMLSQRSLQCGYKSNALNMAHNTLKRSCVSLNISAMNDFATPFAIKAVKSDKIEIESVAVVNDAAVGPNEVSSELNNKENENSDDELDWSTVCSSDDNINIKPITNNTVTENVTSLQIQHTSHTSTLINEIIKAVPVTLDTNRRPILSCNVMVAEKPTINTIATSVTDNILAINKPLTNPIQSIFVNNPVLKMIVHNSLRKIIVRVNDSNNIIPGSNVTLVNDNMNVVVNVIDVIYFWHYADIPLYVDLLTLYPMRNDLNILIANNAKQLKTPFNIIEFEINDQYKPPESLLQINQPTIFDKTIFDSTDIDRYILNFQGVERNDKLYANIMRYENELLDGQNRAFAKFEWMTAKYVKNSQTKTLLDLSSAPGYLHQLKFKTIIACNWRGENACIPKFNNKFNKVYSYDDLDKLNVHDRYDVIYVDIGDDKHTFRDYHKILRFIRPKNTIIVKFFLEHAKELMSFANHFGNALIIKPAYSCSINREVYGIFSSYRCNLINHDNLIKAQLSLILKRIVKAHESYLNDGVPMIHSAKESAPPIVLDINVDKDAIPRYMRTLNSNTNGLGDFMRLVRKRVESLPANQSFQVNVYNGPPGCGKSNYIIHQYTNSDLVIVPTRELCEKYIKRKINNTMTMHKALLTDRKFNTIFIDEAFMLGKGYIHVVKALFPTSKIQLFGDIHQIGIIGFEQTLDPNDVFTNIPYNIFVSKRCPIDVTNLQSTYHYSTTNNILFSVVNENYNNFYRDEKYKAVKVITYTQKMKDNLKALSYDCSTIHEYEGSETAHCVWYVDVNDAKMLANSPQHVTVALTRHYNSLIIVGPLPDTITLNYQNSVFERINENIGVTINSSTLYNEAEMSDAVNTLMVKKMAPEMFRDKFDKYDVNRVVEIIGKFNNLSGVAATFRSVDVRELPPSHQGKAQVNIDALTGGEITTSARFLTPFNTARNYESKNVLAATKTMIGRYLSKTKIVDDDEADAMVLLLNEGVNKFLRYKVNSPEFMQHMETTEEEWVAAYVEYIKVLQSKKLDESVFDHEFDELQNKAGINLIQFFMKKQDKNDINWEHTLRDKLGQGVNAWHKILNAVYAASARVYACKIKTLLKHNVVIASGQSDVDLGNEIAALINKAYRHNTTPHLLNGIDDFTEFDASQNLINIRFEKQFMVCRNPYFLSKYEQFRSAWTSVFRGNCMINGVLAQHSGQPYTFDFNSLNCLGLNGILFDFDEFVVAAFKGDDFYICAHQLAISEHGCVVVSDIGMKCKLAIEPVSEFVGYIVTKYGFFPDLIRICQKLLNKAITDADYFEELKLAAYDRLQVLDNDNVVHYGRLAYMHYINTLMRDSKRNATLNENDVDEMLGLLFNLKNIQFEQLIPLTKSSVVFEPTKHLPLIHDAAEI